SQYAPGTKEAKTNTAGEPSRSTTNVRGSTSVYGRHRPAAEPGPAGSGSRRPRRAHGRRS
ncbi:MAG: hypothetical protein ACRDNX_08595, partial [Gaiellaceae bacterium]